MKATNKPTHAPLHNHPLPLLKDLLETLEAKYPPAVVTRTSDLNDPHKLSFQAGQNSVLDDVRAAIKIAERKTQ